MASYRAKWTLSVLALMGCVLIGTVASDTETLAALRLKLKQDNLTFDQTRTILQNYEYPEEVLDYFTVGELAGTCEMSPSKCSHEEFLVMSYKIGMNQRGLPQVSEYVKECVRATAKDYCKEHIDEVAKSFLDSVSEKKNELIQSILEPLKEAGVMDRAPDLNFSYWVADEDSIYFEKETEHKEGNEKLYPDIVKAYTKAMHSKLGDSPSPDQKDKFLADVLEAFGPHTLNYFFMLEISNGNKEGPEPGNVLVTDLYKSSRIAAHFSAGVWRKIDREAKEKLGNVLADKLYKIVRSAAHSTGRVWKTVADKLNEIIHPQ